MTEQPDNHESPMFPLNPSIDETRAEGVISAQQWYIGDGGGLYAKFSGKSITS